MKSEFCLIGLSKPRSFTCTNAKGEIFWAKSAMPYERFEALFSWATNAGDFWKSKWVAEIKHEGLFEDGTPKNPMVTSVREIS